MKPRGRRRGGTGRAADLERQQLRRDPVGLPGARVEREKLVLGHVLQPALLPAAVHCELKGAQAADGPAGAGRAAVAVVAVVGIAVEVARVLAILARAHGAAGIAAPVIAKAVPEPVVRELRRTSGGAGGIGVAVVDHERVVVHTIEHVHPGAKNGRRLGASTNAPPAGKKRFAAVHLVRRQFSVPIVVEMR